MSSIRLKKIIRESVSAVSTFDQDDAVVLFQETSKALLKNKLKHQDQDSFARQVIIYLLNKWWDCRYEGTGYPISKYFAKPVDLCLSFEQKSLLDILEKACRRMDTLETGYLVGNLYTSLIPDEIRSKNGVYFTPPHLTARLIDLAEKAGVNWSTAKILDPACGGGAFLAPIAVRIISALPFDDADRVLDHLGNHLQGLEIDAFSAWISQVFLDAVVGKIAIKAKRRLAVLVKIDDSITLEGLENKYDLVIGNPPFGKIKIDNNLRARFSESLYGHANLYGLFIHLAFTFVRKSGIVAFINPTGFLGGEYFKNLRSFILRSGAPVNIDFVNTRKGVFDGVLQETLLATYRAGEIPRPVTVSKLNTLSIKKIKVEKLGVFNLPSEKDAPWILPRISEQIPSIAIAGKLSSKLKDWGYEVKTGPLVWNRKKEQLTNKRSKSSFPLIWAESVCADNKFEWKAEFREHTRFFNFKQGDEWLLTKDSCLLLQRTTSKEQYCRLVSAILPFSFVKHNGAVVVENHLNIIRPINKKPLVPLKVLNDFINSRFADSIFRCISGSVAVSAYELEQMPLPDPATIIEIYNQNTKQPFSEIHTTILNYL